MTNKSAIEVIASRQSVVPSMLVAPAPNQDDLKTILETAMSAPDHAHLHPMRFMIIQGEDQKNLGDLFAEGFEKRTDPEYISDALIEKERERPQKAPMIIAVLIKTTEHPKVPEIEQYLTVGAAIQNMLNTIHALGYGGIFLTGGHAYDEYIIKNMGVPDDMKLIGFLHVGSVSEKLMQKKRKDPMEYFVDHKL